MVQEAAAKKTVLTSSIDRQPSGAAMDSLRKEAVQKWGVSERWDNNKSYFCCCHLKRRANIPSLAE